MSGRALPLVMSSLIAAWLGAAVLVGAVVAPAAFAVLPTRTLAGALVGRVLPALFWSGLLLGAVVALLGKQLGAGRIGTGAAAAFAVACAVAQLVVSPRIEALRQAIGGAVDVLDPADPRRIAFGRLHGFSVMWMGVGTLAALVALVLISRAFASTVPR